MWDSAAAGNESSVGGTKGVSVTRMTVRPRARETDHSGPSQPREGSGFYSKEMGLWAKEWHDLPRIFKDLSVWLLGGE